MEFPVFIDDGDGVEAVLRHQVVRREEGVAREDGDDVAGADIGGGGGDVRDVFGDFGSGLFQDPGGAGHEFSAARGPCFGVAVRTEESGVADGGADGIRIGVFVADDVERHSAAGVDCHKRIVGDVQEKFKLVVTLVPTGLPSRWAGWKVQWRRMWCLRRLSTSGLPQLWMMVTETGLPDALTVMRTRALLGVWRCGGREGIMGVFL